MNNKMGAHHKKDNNSNTRGNSSGNSTCCGELRRFGELTSVKGVGRSIRADTLCLLYMWAGAVVGFFGVTVFNVFTLCDDFLQFGTGTKITEKTMDLVEDNGSDILLCNVNPYSKTQINKTLKLVESYHRLLNDWTQSESESEDERREMNSMRDEMLTGQLGLFQHIGATEASNISHSLDQFLLACYIHFIDGVMERKIPCSVATVNVKTTVNKEYFNCFKIYGENNRGSRPSVGMSFLLYIYDVRDDVRINLNGFGGKGAMLTLMEKDSFLNPYTKGIEILPSKVNTVQFSRTKRVRLPEPHGNCKNRNDLKHKISERFTHGKSMPYLYTEDSCLSSCIEYNIIQTCGCQDVGQYGILLDVFNNVSMCGATDQGKDVFIDRMQCSQKWRSILRRQCLQKCPPPCEEVVYDRHVTYLEMSPSELKYILEQERIKSSVPEQDVNQIENTQEFLLKYSVSDLNISNMALIQLRRASNSYYIVEDIKAMTISDFLAKIGGTLNLWSGITVFVIVEVIDLIIRLISRTLSGDEVKTVKQKQEICSHDTCMCDKYSVDNYNNTQNCRSCITKHPCATGT